jgi:hypothetical protein
VKVHVVREHKHDSSEVNTRCALSSDFMTGTFIFAKVTATATTYLDMLGNYAVAKILKGYFFQQNGAPPHYANTLTDLLNKQFPDKFVGRGGPLAWPPRSSDFTPLDFLVCGYIKNTVYQMQVRNDDDMHSRIITSCESTTPEMLQNTWQEAEYRCDICCATKGTHVQIF